MSPEINRDFSRPISPEELNEVKSEILPPEVFETFNRLLGEKALHGYAIIYQDEVVEGLIERGLDRGNIFRKGWLNIESLYEENGWEVEYDKPDYNEEGGRAYFTFEAKKAQRGTDKGW